MVSLTHWHGLSCSSLYAGLFVPQDVHAIDEQMSCTITLDHFVKPTF